MAQDNFWAYLRMAHQFAEQSPDPSTQNGAVLVGLNEHRAVMDGTREPDEQTVIGAGCNEFPNNVLYSEGRLERPLKYSFIEHAERNAIFDAVRRGNSPVGSTMYVLWAACADCARAIIQAGVSRVVTCAFYHQQDSNPGNIDPSRKNWSESIDPAFLMLSEAGVEVIFYDQSLNAPNTVLFNGVPINL
jgi:dCMP deaminase